MFLDCSLAKLKPEASILPKNAAGVILAVAVMCASASCTDHCVHSERVDH